MAISCSPSDLLNSARCFSSCGGDPMAIRNFLLLQFVPCVPAGSPPGTPPVVGCNAPAAPANLEVTPIANNPGSTTIAIDWTQPASNPPVTTNNYAIIWSVPRGPINFAVIPGTQLNYTITGLTPSTDYSIVVRAIHGACASSSSVLHTTTAGSGPPPNGLLNGLLFYWDGSSLASKVNVGNLSVQLDAGCNPTIQTNQAGGIISRTFQSQDCQNCQTVTAALLGDANMATGMNGGVGVSFTISLWALFYRINTWQCNTFSYLMSKINGNLSVNGDWLIGSDSGGATAIQWGCVQASDNSKKLLPIMGLFNALQWYHIAVGYNDATKQMFGYLNNVSLGTTACQGVTASGQSVAIFNDPVRLFDQSSCKLTEIGFWNRALSIADVNNLFNTGAGLPFSQFTT